MAITRVYYHILKEALKQGMLPQSASILEFGEANIYGDVQVQEFVDDAKELVADPDIQQQLIEQLMDRENPAYLYDAAKVLYRVLFSAKRMVAIDLNGSENALKYDLNEPVPMDEQFDVTINNGTAEHVFNIGQTFKTIHERTRSGGLMIHEGPFTGWFNHGFYNLQPTLFYDLAAANGYAILGYFYSLHKPPQVIQIENPESLLSHAENKQIPENAVLIILMRKPGDGPFVYPMQGYYDNRLDQKQADAWHNMRSK